MIAAAALAAVCASAWAFNRVLRPSVSGADIRVSEVRRGDIANAVNAVKHRHSCPRGIRFQPDPEPGRQGACQAGPESRGS
ncbi:hypothetical protein LP419_33290 [Massilia sp. H-1]|nr:hypothetical protein LP419_33290 [Massilia sp. H-1]